MRNAPNFNMLPANAPPSKCWLTANVDKMTSITTATRSSTTRMPKTIPVNFCWRRFMSLKALKTIAVEDMDSIPPKNMQLICENPIRFPAVYPRNIIPHTMVKVAITALNPTFSNFLKEKSSPMANKRKMTPISAQILILAVSETVGKKLSAGPVNKPATI